MYLLCYDIFIFFFFFNDTATTEIYTLSLHDALPISCSVLAGGVGQQTLVDLPQRDGQGLLLRRGVDERADVLQQRSEEHTSELQSRQYLVCRLLLEKKKKKQITHTKTTTKLVDNRQH